MKNNLISSMLTYFTVLKNVFRSVCLFTRTSESCVSNYFTRIWKIGFDVKTSFDEVYCYLKSSYNIYEGVCQIQALGNLPTAILKLKCCWDDIASFTNRHNSVKKNLIYGVELEIWIWELGEEEKNRKANGAGVDGRAFSV